VQPSPSVNHRSAPIFTAPPAILPGTPGPKFKHFNRCLWDADLQLHHSVCFQHYGGNHERTISPAGLGSSHCSRQFYGRRSRLEPARRYRKSPPRRISPRRATVRGLIFSQKSSHQANPPTPPISLLAQVPAAKSRHSVTPGRATPTIRSPPACQFPPAPPTAPSRTSAPSGPTQIAPARSTRR